MFVWGISAQTGTQAAREAAVIPHPLSDQLVRTLFIISKHWTLPVLIDACWERMIKGKAMKELGLKKKANFVKG